MRQVLLVIGACLILSQSIAAQRRGIGSLYTANLPGDSRLPLGAVNITDILIERLGNDGSDLNDIHGVTRAVIASQ